MSPNLLVPLVLLGILLLTVSWVYQDAASHVAAGEPVVLRYRTFRLETPSAWAAVCLVLWVFFFPLYLRARQHTI
jgi:hypothetical protein